MMISPTNQLKVGTIVSLEFPVYRGKWQFQELHYTAKIAKAVVVKVFYEDGRDWVLFYFIESKDLEMPEGYKRRFRLSNAEKYSTILSQPVDV